MSHKAAKRKRAPRQIVDWDKMRELKIKCGQDSFTGLVLTSNAEMKRALAGGAIRWE